MNTSVRPTDVRVWVERENAHRSICYTITIGNGKPQCYTRTVYNTDTNEVVAMKSGTDVYAVPQYVRDEVEQQMIPKGAW